MSELEPTITKLEPTATERLRALLTERGVDYRISATGYSIDIGPYTTAYANRSDTTLDVSLRQVTPEQAIAATLGSCNCSNSERTSDSDATAERRGDAVEVVRCRDCACFSVDDSDHDYRTGWWCKRWYTDMVMPDGFCAWASRKESE